MNIAFDEIDDGRSVVFNNEKKQKEFIPDYQPWNRFRRGVWLSALFCAGAVLYAARTVMPVCIVTISQQYGWNKTDTGTVLSSFFWGYATTQILGGYLADRFGGETIISGAVIGWSLLTFITPLVIQASSRSFVRYNTIISRILIGCFQGVYYPSISSLLSKKVLASDRAFSFSFASSGSHFGTLLTGMVGSILLDYVGWTYPFYCIGIFGMAWVGVIHYHLIDDTHSLRLSSSKKDLTEELRTDSPRLTLVVPWTKLFRRVPFWAIIFGQFCGSWTFFILLSWLPTYFHETFPDAKGWIFNVVPWAVSLPCQWFSGWLSDQLIVKGYSTTFVRKFIQSISFCGAGFFLFSMSYMTTYESALICMTTAIAFCAFHHSAISVNVQDIAPDHAGSVFGLMNTAGAIPGFIGVYVAGYMLDRWKSWSIVFNMTSAVCFTGCLMFTAFGTGQRIV